MVDSESEEPRWADPLSCALTTVRLKGSFRSSAEFSAPWGVAVRGFDDLACYLIVRGGAHLELQGGGCGAVALAAGDVAMVCPERPHALRDAPGSPLVALERVVAMRRGAHGTLRVGGGGATTTLICGCLQLDRAGRELLLSKVPPLIHLPAETATAGQIGTVQALAGEVARPEPGSLAVVARLAEALFIQALRAVIARDAADSGWLRALGHPALARALAAVHDDPGAPWTVASLAARAAMSRSAFAAEFARLVGEPPLGYVTSWRMRRAAQMLERGRLGLAEIAARVGYGSDEAFSRAFRQWAGVPPGEYRRRERARRRGRAAAE